MPEQILQLRRSKYNDDEIVFAMMKFHRKFFAHDSIPKQQLNQYAQKNKLPAPVYHTQKDGRLYYSVIEFLGKKYSSLLWHREKKIAEQHSALVCLHQSGQYQEDYLIAIGCLVGELPKEDVYEAQFESD